MKRLLFLLLETLMGDLLCSRGYAHNFKALKMDLESEVRTGRDFSSGVKSEVGGVKPPAMEMAELDVGLLTPAFGLCASMCLLGRKVWEAAE